MTLYQAKFPLRPKRKELPVPKPTVGPKGGSSDTSEPVKETDWDLTNLRYVAKDIVVAALNASFQPQQDPDVVKAASAFLTAEFTKHLPPATVPKEARPTPKTGLVTDDPFAQKHPASAFNPTGD